MKYIKNSETRKRLDFQMGNPADGNNTALAELIIQKRHEQALIQGKSSYVYNQINENQRMAQNPQTVQDFLDDIWFMFKDQAIEEEEALRQYKVRTTGDKNAVYEKWDYAYFGSKQIEERFNQTEE